MNKLDDQEIERTKRAFELSDGHVAETARRLGLNRTTVRDRLIRLGLTKAHVHAKKKLEDKSFDNRKIYATPAKTRVVIMTAMQDDTGMYPGWRNLEAYAGHRKGELLVGGFTYNKKLYTDHQTKHARFHHEALKYLNMDIIQLAPKLVWYGDFNVLPTSSDPLEGWDTQTRDNWAVFPHAKIRLKCIPSMPGTFGKQIMTTGVITRANYIKKNAGQKAEFHHTPGATIAEIKPDGTFFLRQLALTHDGSFQDLDVMVKDGKIFPGPRIAAITYGDIHREILDPTVAKILWGYDVESGENLYGGSMLETLRPLEQHFHDSFDFKARNSHTRNDPHERQIRNYEKCNSVENMLDETAQFLAATMRPWSRSVHIASNHNEQLDRWLKSPDGQWDSKNAVAWHSLNAAWHEAIKRGDLRFEAFEYALKNREHDLSEIKFVRRGHRHVICRETQPVECGLHADIGPRGAKGTASNLAKMVERINGAHTHEPAIIEGTYLAGTSSVLDVPYAVRGPGAWHQSEIVTYASGKRTIVTLSNGAFRA